MGKDPKALSVSHPNKLVPEISAELDQVVASATAFEPEQRYQSAGELKLALEDCLLKLKQAGVS